MVLCALLMGIAQATAQTMLHSEADSSRTAVQPTTTDAPSMLRGYAQFDLAPPHNEIDPGICGVSTDASSTCTAFARYMLSGHIEARPFESRLFNKTPVLRRFYGFADSSFLFGNNLPQKKYTWSAKGIGWEREWGLAATLPKGFEARVLLHYLFKQFQSYSQSSAYIDSNGPWGRYTSVAVRKYFGYRGSSPQ